MWYGESFDRKMVGLFSLATLQRFPVPLKFILTVPTLKMRIIKLNTIHFVKHTMGRKGVSELNTKNLDDD